MTTYLLKIGFSVNTAFGSHQKMYSRRVKICLFAKTVKVTSLIFRYKLTTQALQTVFFVITNLFNFGNILLFTNLKNNEYLFNQVFGKL